MPTYFLVHRKASRDAHVRSFLVSFGDQSIGHLTWYTLATDAFMYVRFIAASFCMLTTCMAALVPVQVQDLREFLVPLLRKVMSSLTQETLHDWAQLASEVSVTTAHQGACSSCAVLACGEHTISSTRLCPCIVVMCRRTETLTASTGCWN